MIYVCGDTHIPIDIYKIPAWVRRVKPTLYDILIIVGDFGLLWNHAPNDTEKFWTDWFNNQKFTTLFIDGNHENFERLNRLKEIEMFDSVVGKVSQKIYHLKRGNVYTIEDKKIFAMGGAESIDKQRRQPYISWWPEEIHSKGDIDNAFEQLSKHNWNVDHVISHTCPKEFIYYDDSFDTCQTNLSEIHSRLAFKHWYFGHFHIDETKGDFTCLFNEIKQLN